VEKCWLTLPKIFAPAAEEDQHGDRGRLSAHTVDEWFQTVFEPAPIATKRWVKAKRDFMKALIESHQGLPADFRLNDLEKNIRKLGSHNPLVFQETALLSQGERCGFVILMQFYCIR